MSTLPRLDLSRLEPQQAGTTVEPAFLGYTPASWCELLKSDGAVFDAELPDGNFVVICGHEANAEAWRMPDAWIYGPPASGGDFFRHELGELHVTQLDGEQHRRARKIILPAFGIASMMRDADIAFDEIVSGVRDCAGHSTNIYEALAVTYTRALSRTQVKVELSEEEIRGMFSFEEAFIAAGFMPAETRNAWFARTRYQELKRSAFSIFESIVDERLAGVRKGDSLDVVLDRKRPGQFQAFNREELVLATYLLLAAGVGNIANIACALLWALGEHPAWQVRLEEELQDFSPDVLNAGMKHLPVTHAVISEAERCYLPAPVVPKLAARDVEIMGQVIPAGSRILHLHGLAHFEEARYPDPHKFRPVRWLDGSAERSNAFGGGVHLCLGMGVTRLYLPLTIAAVINNATFNLDEPPTLLPIAEGVDVSPVTTRCMGTFSAR